MKRLIITFIAILCFSTILSAQTPGFKSHDLFVDDLRGNVAKVELFADNCSIKEVSYNERGHRIYPGCNVNRDKQNRITQIQTNDNVGYYYSQKRYYDTNNRLISKYFESDEESGYHKYTYDNNGTLIREEYSDINLPSSLTVYLYTILERDSKGNWIRRRTKTTYLDGTTTTSTETRKITYR